MEIIDTKTFYTKERARKIAEEMQAYDEDNLLVGYA